VGETVCNYMGLELGWL